MNLQEIIKRCGKHAAPYRVDGGKKFQLKDHDPGDTGHLHESDKERAKKDMERSVEAMVALQERLYAQDKWAVLLIFQAMDAAGKDGVIKHVMSGINPQGCQVYSFKSPSNEELDHDYLWRCTKSLPERGRIGIFNRSYYEEVLVVRVHPEILKKQKLPTELITKHVWKERYEDIRNFEQHLARNGVAICKFFLNVSRDEQKRRFLDRLENPDKQWKFSSADARERQCWTDYMAAYEETIQATATKSAPWYVLPADHKWFTRYIAAAAIVETLGALHLKFPEVDDAKKAELAQVDKLLRKE